MVERAVEIKGTNVGIQCMKTKTAVAGCNTYIVNDTNRFLMLHQLDRLVRSSVSPKSLQ